MSSNNNEIIFNTEAIKTLSYIAEAIEAKDEDCLIEVDFMQDILKLYTPEGEYVINKHSAAKQIWLASPISGPYHFSLLGGRWINKDAIELLELLSKELQLFFQIDLKYE